MNLAPLERSLLYFRVLRERNPPQNRAPLMKFFDVINALDLEYKDLGISVPASWKGACDEADRFETERRGWRLFTAANVQSC